MNPFPILSVIIFLPLFGGLLVLVFRRRTLICRWLALAVAMADLGLVVFLFFQGLKMQTGETGTWMLVEDVPWIQSLGIRYSLGLDGVSLMLILLTVFLIVLCVLVSWKHIQTRVAAFHFFLLFSATSILGVFLATDLFLFYLFWEVQVIPVFFLIGVWGYENRIRAAIKFILYTLAGSMLMLIALISLYLTHGMETGIYTFSLARLIGTSLSRSGEIWLYAAFLLAFAIKVPAFPLHSWLPDAHTEAPTAGSVILAGLLLKTGTYAIFRFAFPIFPVAAGLSVPLLLTSGLIGLFYAAWVAFSQRNIKRLVAYSSIAHMGLVIIGLAIWNLVTLNGALLQMINHGLSTSALFIMVGMLDERVGSREIEDFGGLWKSMPVFSAFFLFFAMSALGLPGLNNFVGEIMILIGTFSKNALVGILGFTGLVFTLVYILRAVQDVLFGKPGKDHKVWDLTSRELIILGSLGLAILFMGLHPQPVIRLFEMSTQHLLGQIPDLTMR